MKSAAAAFTLLASLLLLDVKGQRPARRKCQCLNEGISLIKPKLIRHYVVNNQSAFCPRLEIVITTARGKQCVNPKSKLGWFLVEAWNDGNERHNVATTPAYQHHHNRP